MAVGPIHALGPASRFRPRFARLIAEGEEETVSPLPVDSVAAIGKPATDATTPNVGRGPIHVRRPLSRFRPRVLGAPTMPPPATEGTVSAGSVASVAAVGSPQVLSTVSGGYVASWSITRPTSRFRPRIQRFAHFAELTGQTTFPSSVASVAALGEPAVTEEFSLDGGGALPEGWTIEPQSVASVAEVGAPTVTDTGAVILAGSVVSNTLIGSPSVFSGEQIRASSVDSVAAVGTPEIVVVETTIRVSGVASVAAVGSPDVDDGIADRKRGGAAPRSLYFVKKDDEEYTFDDEEEAIRFAQEQESPKPRKAVIKSLAEPVKPPPEPTPEELAEQARQAELAAIKAEYEARMRQIVDEANATLAVAQAEAELLKADNAALQMLIEG